MFFYAWVLLWYLRFEDTGRRRWYWLGAGAFGLALLSKTAVAPLPVVLLGLAWWRRGRVETRDLWRSLPFFAVAALVGSIAVWFQFHQGVVGSGIVRQDDGWSRLAGAGWAIWFYLYKVVWPLNLAFVYPRWRVDGTNIMSYVPGVLLAAGFVACWHYRRQAWGKALLFGLGYFVVMLLPVLGFVNIYFMRYSLVADHWQYFSVIGLVALAAAGMTAACRRYGPGRPLLAGTAGGLLLLALGVLTWRQCGMYADVETLWRTSIARCPESSLPYSNLGYVALQKGRIEEAILCFQKALKLTPGFAEARENLGDAFMQLGRPEDAIAQFKLAVEADPVSGNAQCGLGNALLRAGRMDEAIEHFQKAVEVAPRLGKAHNNLGGALLQRGRVEEAIAQFRQVPESDPDFATAQNNLGVALTGEGEPAEAIAPLQRAAQRRPDDAQVRNNLGYALLRGGQPARAIEQLQKALQLQPNHVKALNNLALLLATCPEASLRDGNRAVEMALRAQELSGGTEPHILDTLAAAYAEAGRFPEAIATAERALELAPAGTNMALADAIRSRLKLYRANSPCHEIP